jgi:hypothetical protein
MNPCDLPEILQFPTIESKEPRDDDAAERQLLGFPELFLKKSRELHEARQELTDVLDYSAREREFVIRNVLDAVENCRSLLEVASPPTSAAEPTADLEAPLPAGDVAGEASEDSKPASSAEQVGLASVRRSLIYILEELGVRRVELLGQNYVSVTVDGRPISDPFEVLSSTQSGKASERTVTQVLRDLWVDRDGRVCQKGAVVC